jgi:hypothetical protein
VKGRLSERDIWFLVLEVEYKLGELGNPLSTKRAGVISGRFLSGIPTRRGKDEGGTQDGGLTMTCAEKYAMVCREGVVLGTGSSPKFRIY